MRLVPLLFTGVAALCPAVGAQAQPASTGSGLAYPTKPIRVVVPFAEAAPPTPWAAATPPNSTNCWANRV